MKERILELIQQRNEFPLNAFRSQIPEITGEFSFMFPSKGIENSNILLMAKVSEEFILVMRDLISSQVLTFVQIDPLLVSFDGGEFYKLPLVKRSQPAYKSLHWLPLMIKRGGKFPKLAS